MSFQQIALQIPRIPEAFATPSSPFDTPFQSIPTHSVIAISGPHAWGAKPLRESTQCALMCAIKNSITLCVRITLFCHRHCCGRQGPVEASIRKLCVNVVLHQPHMKGLASGGRPRQWGYRIGLCQTHTLSVCVLESMRRFRGRECCVCVNYMYVRCTYMYV